jgi:death-on-curing protein
VIYLRLDDIIEMNAILAGPDGIGDIGLIESACGRPQASAFGEDAYPTIWEKSAALMQSLACNHGFVDGNKRTALMATVVFLGVNGHALDPKVDQGAVEELVMAVATGRLRTVQSIASALVKFCR